MKGYGYEQNDVPSPDQTIGFLFKTLFCAPIARLPYYTQSTISHYLQSFAPQHVPSGLEQLPSSSEQSVKLSNCLLTIATSALIMSSSRSLLNRSSTSFLTPSVIRSFRSLDDSSASINTVISVLQRLSASVSSAYNVEFSAKYL